MVTLVGKLSDFVLAECLFSPFDLADPCKEELSAFILYLLLFRSQLQAELLSHVLHHPIFQVIKQRLGGHLAHNFILEEQISTFDHLGYRRLGVLPDLVLVELLALADGEQCFKVALLRLYSLCNQL